MRLSHLVATLLLAALLGCSATASGAVTPAPGKTAPTASPTASASPTGCDKDFTAFDLDKDGAVSLDEYKDGRWGQIRFIRAPTAEEEANMKAGFRAAAEKADASKDGKLDRAEFGTTCQ